MKIKDLMNFVKDLFRDYIALIGIIFSIIEILKQYKIDLKCVTLPMIFIIPFIVVAICFIKKMYNITYRIPGTEHTITIRFGNILRNKNTASIVGINTKLETHSNIINPKSIHGQLIKTNGQETITNIFNKHRNELSCITGTELFEYGEYFTESIDKKEYIFLVMSELKKRGGAKADVNNVKKAIDKMFQGFINKGGIINQDIDCPLLGTGIVDASWDDEACIKYIVKKYIIYSQKNSLGIKHFRLCIHYKKIFSYSVLKMYKLKQYCELVANECISCTII